MNNFKTVLDNINQIIEQENDNSAQEIHERMKKGEDLKSAITVYDDMDKNEILVFREQEVFVPAKILGRLLSRLKNHR
ncbi:MAG TPA: hypothetical protein VK590_04440 [Saprospiraceae bacterium]|nr:hypothetical protein [Saprospiraceae bacterium]